MPLYTTFDRFARDLFLLSTNSELIISNKTFRPISFLTDASGTLDYFIDGHATFFREIFDRNYEYRDLRNDEQFFRFAIPRCLKLIDDERYFYSGMLVASFLQEFVRFMKDTRYCYRFCFTAYKCFWAVFKRALVDDFEDHGGLEGLEKFSKQAFKSVDSMEIYESLPSVFNNDVPCLVERVVKLIEKCDQVDDKTFHLNDYEFSLLRNDDVDEELGSLENDITGKDPLNLQWPPSREEIRERVRAAREAYESNKLHSIDNSEYEKRKLSDLAVYIAFLEREAKDLMGYQEFKEKQKLRKCPCCGIKCFQFSVKLYLKQLESVLVDDSDTE